VAQQIHLALGGVVVNIATEDDEGAVTFRAAQFDRAYVTSAARSSSAWTNRPGGASVSGPAR